MTKKKVEEVKEEAVNDCIHQNQGEGKCLDCGVTINQ